MCFVVGSGCCGSIARVVPMEIFRDAGLTRRLILHLGILVNTIGRNGVNRRRISRGRESGSTMLHGCEKLFSGMYQTICKNVLLPASKLVRTFVCNYLRLHGKRNAKKMLRIYLFHVLRTHRVLMTRDTCSSQLPMGQICRQMSCPLISVRDSRNHELSTVGAARLFVPHQMLRNTHIFLRGHSQSYLTSNTYLYLA